MNTAVDRRGAKANEPITLKVSIAGSGNIKLLEAPEIELPSDFEQYTPKVSENIERRYEKISGSKTFEYLLIPRYPGRKTIKPVTFTFFDVAKREYVTLQSSQIDLSIEQGETPPGPPVAGIAREDVQMLSQDIRFIKVGGGSLARKGEYFHTSGTFVVMLVLPLAAILGSLVYARKRQTVLTDAAGYRNRKAIKVAQRGLKHAEELLRQRGGRVSSVASERNHQFYLEVSRALWKYLGDKLNIGQADLSIDGAMVELSKRSVNGGLAAELRALLESCEMARFAPTSLGASSMQKTYDAAKKIIVELERTLRPL
jgi:hypothetical protein